MMSGTAPGKCADCGSDAYIQLAVEDAMLCAHCYQDRLGLTKKALGRKAGEAATTLATATAAPAPGTAAAIEVTGPT